MSLTLDRLRALKRQAGATDAVPAASPTAPTQTARAALPDANAGTSPRATRAEVCRPHGAEAWIGRAASAAVIEQARLDSGSQAVRLVMPGEAVPQVQELDRLNLFLDERSLVTRATCG